MFVSRDVRFYEAIFPCAEPTSQIPDPMKPTVTLIEPYMSFSHMDDMDCVGDGLSVSAGLGLDTAAQPHTAEREKPGADVFSSPLAMGHSLDASARKKLLPTRISRPQWVLN